jgi:dTDP-4-dehydrorhamnose reductase
LNEACRQHGARLIHVSTDCVFNGKKLAPYLENDIPDAQDMYGRTKLMGEVSSTPGITLRTSIIGRELKGTSGLVEWFLSQKGTIKGFSKALYTGFTTREFVNIVKLVIDQNLGPGIYQVSSDPISKYDLLSLVRKEFNLQTEIEINDSFVCDRRLDSSRFRKLTGYLPKSWPVMIAEMAADTSPYEKWRQ